VTSQNGSPQIRVLLSFWSFGSLGLSVNSGHPFIKVERDLFGVEHRHEGQRP
jgi:hypothetical protein